MKRFPKILAMFCTALALSASLALAAEPAKKAPAKPAQPAHQMGQMGGGMMGGMSGGGMMGGMSGGGMMGGGQMGLSALSPEKQELAKAIIKEHHEALFPLHQSMYAKKAELEAVFAAGNGDSSQAQAVIREIADLKAKELAETGKFRARLAKETGLRTAPMGHGMMGGQSGGMMGGMMGGQSGGMMGGGMMGGMSCPMMQQMGGMQHGAPAAAPATTGQKAPAKAPAHKM